MQKKGLSPLKMKREFAICSNVIKHKELIEWILLELEIEKKSKSPIVQVMISEILWGNKIQGGGSLKILIDEKAKLILKHKDTTVEKSEWVYFRVNKHKEDSIDLEKGFSKFEIKSDDLVAGLYSCTAKSDLLSHNYTNKMKIII